MATLLRTIQSPGVEIREIDKSQYTPAIEGTYCVVAGYADKGEEHEPSLVANVQDLITTYGEPTNEAERYFYYAGREVLNAGGTLIAAKLPYNNVISRNYKAIGVTIDSGAAITSGSPDVLQRAGELGYTMFAEISASTSQFNLPTSDYDNLLAGLTFADGLGGSEVFPTTASQYNFLIVNKTKETIQGNDENQGILITFVDAVDAMNVQRVLTGSADSDSMNLLSGFITPSNNTYTDGTEFAVKLINQFKYSSVSENIMRQFPTIEFLEGGDAIDKTYSHHLGVVVCQVFEDKSAGDGKLNVGIIEAFVGSIHNDERNPATGQSVYIRDIINAGSRYIYMFDNPTLFSSLPVRDPNIQDEDTVLFKDAAIYPLIGFTDDETAKRILGGEIPEELRKVYEKISNIDDVQLDVVLDAGLSTIAQFTNDDPISGTLFEPDTDVDPDDVLIQFSSDLDLWRAVCDEMITLCKDTRRDCMAIVDVPRHLVIEGRMKYIRPTKPANTFSNTIGQKLKFVTGLNSSYAALYGNWFRMVDGFTGNNFWIPQSVKMGGIYCFNDRIANIWDAPAGLNRGVVYGVNDLAYNPTPKNADQLYIKSINYAKKYPLDGFIAEGQKTTQVKPSAFDRVNVRRLFLRLERLTYQVARYFVYEPNNYFTRRRLIDMLDPIFSAIKQRGGMYDYRIVCDETNNTPDVIDRNELKLAILIKPVKTAEFILVDFIATRTDASFEEVLQEVG